ncbi:MAG: flavin reductase family protein, partial [Actinobacteria bacterium]|nr:flavin reductase family protein [Actinomycetota bacterium]
ETGEFVFNLCTWDLREQMNETSATAARSVDEMAAAGLAPAASVVVRPPRVAAAPIALECTVEGIVELPSTPSVANAMVIGRVVQVHIADDVVVDGMVDLRRARPIGRLGYHDYVAVEETFTMVRPA